MPGRGSKLGVFRLACPPLFGNFLILSLNVCLQMKADGTMEHMLGGGRRPATASFSRIILHMCLALGTLPISPLLTMYPQVAWEGAVQGQACRWGGPGQAMSLPVVSQGQRSSCSPAPCPHCHGECCIDAWGSWCPAGGLSQLQVPLISFLTFNKFY